MIDKFLYRIDHFDEDSIPSPIFYVHVCSEQYTMNHYHWHVPYEINMVFEGRFRVVNNLKTIEGDRPTIFIHCPYSMHIVNAFEGVRYRRKILYVSQEIVTRCPLGAANEEALHNANLIWAQPDEAEWEELNSYMDRIDQHQQDETSVALLTSMLIHRIMQVASAGRGEIVSCPFFYIQDALQYISDNLSEPYSIEQLSQRYSVGRSKFQSDFKATTGLPYRKYLIALRLARAREMLLAGESIIKTSMETGYSSEAHFVKAFREYWSITPGEFIRQITR